MRAVRRRVIATGWFVACAIILAGAATPLGARPGDRAAQASERADGPVSGDHEKWEQHEIDALLHSDGSGKLRPDLYRKSLKAFANLKIDASRTLPGSGTKKSAASGATASAGGGGVVGVQWTQIGPAPLIIDAEQNFQGQGPDAGQVVSIAIDPRNTADKVIYAAFNDGGVWKSTDGGDTWQPKTDYMPTLSIGALALDPANPSIVYAGTGNIYNNGFFKGIGVYRSTDAGDTWSLTSGSPALKDKGVNFIVMPSADTLLVATKAGLFRSTNAGGIFNQVSVGGTTGAFITDLDLDTQNPNTVYAAVSGQGIFVSTDGGQTFPASSNLWGNGTGGPTGSYKFVSFAQSTAPDGNTMYADAQAVSGPPNFAGMWKSTDGGQNWTDITAAASPGTRLDKCQCGYDQTIGVDPVDAGKVYIGFQELWYSSDGGGSFSNISDGAIHWDHHALVFSPPGHRASGDDTTRVWAGTDGGIHYSDDAGGSWVQRNGAIATNLFRAMDIGRGASNNGYSYGGAQDTGSMRHKPTDSGTEWHEAVDADGGPMAVDWQNPDNAFGISNGGFIRTTNGGDSWIRPGSGDIGCVPMSAGAAVDPNDGQHVYVPVTDGTLNSDGSPCSKSIDYGIFRSFDGGATFNASDFVASPGGRRVTFIATTPTDSNLVWVTLCTPVSGGCTPGAVAVSTNFQSASPTFTLKTVTGAPTANPIGIAIDPQNTDRVVVVYPGYSNTVAGALSKHVFMTTDGGDTWADIGGTALDPAQMVPDMPLYSVVIDPQTTPHSIIVSTDLGILRSLDEGATWQILGVGLPNVNATSLQIDYTVTPSLLRVGTYGRSAFELTTATGPLLAVNCNLGFGFVTVGTTATRQCQLFNVGSTDLHVNGFFRASGSTTFTIASGPATPVTVAPGSHIDYTIAFSPTSPGDESATFQVNSDDPFQPVYQIPASGTGVTGNINVSPTHLAYGGVAVDNRTNPSTKTLTTTLSNQASCAFCDLHVSGLAITGANAGDFELVGAPSLPFTLAAGNAVELSVRFNPSAGGPRAATLTISSDDPFNPTVQVALDGTGLKPAIDAAPATLIFGPTVFDPDCGTLCGSTLSEQFTNSGQAELIVDVVGFTGPFSGPGATSPPTRIEPGSILTEQVTFHPTAAARIVTGNLHVEDSMPFDPGNVVARDVPLCGEAVGRGIRVLVVDSTGVPVPNVDRLKLTANGVSSPPNVNLKDLPLQTIDPPASCQRIQMHYENQNLSSTSQTAPKSSYYTLSVAVGNKKSTLTFGLAVNEFKLIVVTIG